MLVLRRQLGESVLLGGSIQVTVSLIEARFVELTIHPPAAPNYCVTVSTESLRPIFPDVNVIALRIDPNSARLAFDLPQGMDMQWDSALLRV